MFGNVATVLKRLVFFSQFGGFWGVGYSWLFGFGRFRCFCVSSCFYFFVGFVFVAFVLFCLFCCWSVLGVLGVCCCFFALFLLVLVCMSWSVFVIVCFSRCAIFLWLAFFSLCLFEWSRRCSSFSFLVCFVCIFSLCLFLSVSSENDCFPCNSSVFWFVKKVTPCISFLFLVLAFCFVLFAYLFHDVLFFWGGGLLIVEFCFESQYYTFGGSASCSHAVAVFCFCCFGSLLFFDFGYLSKTSLKHLEIPKTPKWKMQKIKDILTRAVSTGVLTKSVLLNFRRAFKLCMFCWKL